MERKQDNEVIYADSPEFDLLIGMTSTDFASFVDTYVNGCAKWKEGVEIMSAQELLQAAAMLKELKRARLVSQRMGD